MKLNNETLNILAKATVTGNTLVLNSGQLDRAVYLTLNKALEAMGGKWDRRAKGHVFESDPRELVDSVMLSGEVTCKKSEFDFFETPVALAKRMVALAAPKPGEKVLEPSAGRGRIVAEIEKCGVKPSMVELEPKCAEYLRKTFGPVMQCDFLSLPVYLMQDVIIANPPFSKRQDIRHINRMLDYLKPGGRLVSVASASVTFREDVLASDFRERVESLGGRIEALPEGTFKESGTGVNTVLVIVGVR